MEGIRPNGGREVAQEKESLKEVPAKEILDKIENGKPVEYDSIIINGNLDLTKLSLPAIHIERDPIDIDYFELSDAKLIESPIEITKSIIKGAITSSNIFFNHEVNFKNVTFYNDVSFFFAIFDGFAGFQNCKFENECVFLGAQFNGFANFSGSRFNDEASFNSSEFESNAIFSEAEFIQDADFSYATLNGETYFSESMFWKNLYFVKSKLNGILLSFQGAKFTDPISEELCCRTAKNILEKNGDREGAGYHFNREMVAKRKQKPWYIRYPEFVFIQLIFGYGVHPFRLWACWFGFVFLFAVIYLLGHGIDAEASQLKRNATLIDYVWFSIATAVTPGYAGYKPTTEFKLVAGLEAILGTFMWAAFIATFARKYMR